MGYHQALIRYSLISCLWNNPEALTFKGRHRFLNMIKLQEIAKKHDRAGRWTIELKKW